MGVQKRPYPVSRLVEELLTSDSDLASASDAEFAEAFETAAVQKGYAPEHMPKVWTLHRTRFKAKAKLGGRSRKRLPKRVANLVAKARQAALEAVADYNNPLSPFRSGSFVVHMHIAWLSLLLAVHLTRGTEPFYVDPRTGKLELVDGEPKWWDLSKCVSEFWKGQECAVSKNIELFIGLRNHIEHALMPELDMVIFGRCQAHLINFESLLESEFGPEYGLQESLSLSLQFSRLRHEERDRASRLLHSLLRPSLRRYIDAFESSLSADILADMAYSFKVFLLPNTGNHRSKDALAVEWVQYDPADPAATAEYAKVVALIKTRNVPVANIVVGGRDGAGEPADSAPQGPALRLTNDPTAPAVRIARDGGDEDAVLVREALSDDLFQAVGNILEANELLAGRSGRFVLGKPVYYRVYSLRQGLGTSAAQQEMLSRAALWDLYAPHLHWFCDLPPEACARMIADGAFSVKYPKLYGLLRLVVVLGSSPLQWLQGQYEQAWGRLSQPPDQYWTLKRLAPERDVADRRLLAIRAPDSSLISVPGSDETHPMWAVLESSELAQELLSAACQAMFESDGSGPADLRTLCWDLDFAAYGAELQRKADAVGAYLPN